MVWSLDKVNPDTNIKVVMVTTHIMNDKYYYDIQQHSLQA